MFYQVDLSNQYPWVYYSHAPKNFEMLGVIKITDVGVYRVGALVQNLETGLYSMFNAGVLSSLDQDLVKQALDRYNKHGAVLIV